MNHSSAILTLIILCITAFPVHAQIIAGKGSSALKNFPFDPFQHPSLLLLKDENTKYSLASKAYKGDKSQLTSLDSKPIKDVFLPRLSQEKLSFVIINDTNTNGWIFDLAPTTSLPTPTYETIKIYNAVTLAQVGTLSNNKTKQLLFLQKNTPYLFEVSFRGTAHQWGGFSPQIYGENSPYNTNIPLKALIFFGLTIGVFIGAIVIFPLLPFTSASALIASTAMLVTGILTNMTALFFIAWLPLLAIALLLHHRQTNPVSIISILNLTATAISILTVGCAFALSMAGVDQVIIVSIITGGFIITGCLYIAINTLLCLSKTTTTRILHILGWIIFSLISTVAGLSLMTVIPLSNIIFDAYYIGVILLFLTTIIGIILSSGRTFNATKKPTTKETALSKSLKDTKEGFDNARLVQVLKREREIMEALREKDNKRTKEMKKEKEKADLANHAKSAFLAVISHEIRTPMTGIMGMVRLLRHTGLNDEQDSHVDTINDSGDAMMALLNDILDYEKIDTGKMEIENIEFDLYNLLTNVQSLMVGRTDEKNIALKLEIEANTPQYIHGDPTRLRQILLNLVSNAIKFTEKGHVALQVKLLDKKDGQYQLYFATQDTGIGIPKEAQENLFNPFSQADSSTSRKYGGSGLGLAICQKLVNAMGGHISINSTIGEGSNFFFSIFSQEGKQTDEGVLLPAVLSESAGKSKEPVKEKKAVSLAEKKEEPKKHKEIENPLNIMVVDDNAINQKVVAGLIAPLGHTTEKFMGGQAAVDALKDNPSKYNLVFMDIEMPGMSGIEATRIIREELKIPKTILPIVALTGNTGDDDIAAYKDIGMNDYLAKPIELDKMEDIISNIGKDERPVESITIPAKPIESLKKETPPMSEEKPKPAPQKVRTLDADTVSGLVIDDSDTPPEPKEQEPKNIKTPAFDEIDTGLTIDEPTEEEIKEIEENDYNPADFDPTTLMSLKTVMDDAERTEMLEDLKTKIYEIYMQMDKSIADEKFDILRARAHDLKGMAGNFGLVGISGRATLIEDAIKTGVPSNSGLKRLLSQLDKDIKQATTFLNQWM